MTVHVATLTGLVDLLDPDPALITPAAIAAALAKLNRWAGNTELPVSDAQHSVLVMEIFRASARPLARFGVHALLHDAHEYLIGDLITPAVKLLSVRLPGLDRHVEIEKHRLDLRILAALGVPLPPPDLVSQILAAVSLADRAAYDVEWRSLMPAANGASPYREDGRRAGAHTIRLKPQAWPEAESAFRAALETELALRRWESAA